MSDFPAMAISIAQATHISGLGRSSLYSAIADGRLKTKKAGRRTLIETEALKAFINALPEARRRRDAA